MHRRADVRAPRRPRDARPGDPGPRHDVAAAVVALQRSAGNQAVGGLLARAPSGDPGTTEKPEGGARVTLGGIGVIPVQSVQLPASAGRAAPGPGRRRPDTPVGGELNITSSAGPHSSALMRASTERKGMSGRVDFADPGLHLELSNAIVSSLQVSTGSGREIETWTLDVEAIAFVRHQPEGGE